MRVDETNHDNAPNPRPDPTMIEISGAKQKARKNNTCLVDEKKGATNAQVRDQIVAKVSYTNNVTIRVRYILRKVKN